MVLVYYGHVDRIINDQEDVDVHLIYHWLNRGIVNIHPVKIRVSYQKLLKYYVLNALHHRKPKTPKETISISIV